MALVQTASRPSPAACTHTGQRHGLRCLVCDHVYAAADLGTLREASRDGRLDACVRAVREAAGPLGSEAHPQRVLSVEMWFLLILLEGIADLLEADLLPFSSLHRPRPAGDAALTISLRCERDDLRELKALREKGLRVLMPSKMSRLLDDLSSKQHRLTQLHQAAIERQLQLRHSASASSSAVPFSQSTAAGPAAAGCGSGFFRQVDGHHDRTQTLP
ncbi:unnamed protein product [Vitrella brassicaformis CCMP3155]|uniref:Uncharacterized protein n=1 Tax=Vitrella brassicaformis (strain CCMP3155) TaxID=1169540 RepID=A0A0G4ELW4_VITBC|nr:unnamed protein product [Vitrella brassicaformis CCMP3155]|eukprot:CEL98009.1 unnamed protein product [Vitrella brassicaformis CCMP3155]